MTSSISLISSPLEATSVATMIRLEPLENAMTDSLRSLWSKSPWMSMTECPRPANLSVREMTSALVLQNISSDSGLYDCISAVSVLNLSEVS